MDELVKHLLAKETIEQVEFKKVMGDEAKEKEEEKERVEK